ncbi:MAG TPA: hypothetical protein VHC19_03375 [Pirellulales bacterium]|nr:hypothetical protein [Pirellulales bacterium]
MKNRAFVGALLGFALGLIVSESWRSAARVAEARQADQRKQQAGSAEPVQAAESADARYARASLKLAQLALREANEANERMPQTVPESNVNQFQQDVRLAELRLKAALDPSLRGFRSENLLLAESAIQVAKDEYQKALLANQQVAGTVGKTRLERLGMEVEACRLNLEREQTLRDDMASRVTDVQWQLQWMRDELLHVRSRVEQLSDLN